MSRNGRFHGNLGSPKKIPIGKMLEHLWQTKLGDLLEAESVINILTVMILDEWEVEVRQIAEFNVVAKAFDVSGRANQAKRGMLEVQARTVIDALLELGDRWIRTKSPFPPT